MAQVKPLKTHSSGYLQEVDTTTDDVTLNSFTVNGGAALNSSGVDFDSGNYLVEKVGGIVKITIPDYSESISYTGSQIDYVEIFNGFTQTTPNRISRTDFTYTGPLLTQEEYKIYDTADGTTILRTITYDYTYSGNQLTNTEVTES